MLTDIQPDKLYWAVANRFEVRIPGQAVLDIFHPGDAEADVKNWVDAVKSQVEKDGFYSSPSDEAIRAELKEYGSWDDTELQDTDQNWVRLVWVLACNIADEETPDCSEPIKQTTVPEGWRLEEHLGEPPRYSKAIGGGNFIFVGTGGNCPVRIFNENRGDSVVIDNRQRQYTVVEPLEMMRIMDCRDHASLIKNF